MANWPSSHNRPSPFSLFTSGHLKCNRIADEYERNRYDSTVTGKQSEMTSDFLANADKTVYELSAYV